MAVRLPLIVSQPARRDAASTEMIENVVAAALLVPRLDANLVGDLSNMELGSTDHLCLQGHGRDLILCSYLTLDEAQAGWARLGLSGHFVDCHLDSAQLRAQARQLNSGRRIFYFHLTSATRITWLLDTCQELVNAQSLQLVSIQLPIRPPVKEPTANGAAAPASSPVDNVAIAKHPKVTPAVAVGTSPALPRTSMPLVVNRQVDDDQEWAGLDQLVDDLDALDL